jgi:hypothetical protein
MRISSLEEKTQSPRQLLFWSYYVNKDLETFNNAYKSARVAGYTDESARNVTTKQWYKHGETFYHQLLHKAEEVLMEDLNLDIWEDIVYKGRKTGDRRVNAKIARIRSETSKFVLLTIGKKIYNRKPYFEKYSKVDLLSDSNIDSLFTKI